MDGLFNVILVTRGDLGLHLIALMEVESILERDTFAFGNGEVSRSSRLFFKVMDPERVRRKQTVVAHMRPSRMKRVGRMIENGNTHDLAIDRSMIIAPFGTFPPSGLIADSGTLHDAAGSRFFPVGQPHHLIEPN